MRFWVIIALCSLPLHLAYAFDTEKASTGRYKVSFVEPTQLPALTVVPKRYFALAQQVTEADRARGIEKHYYPTRVSAFQSAQKVIDEDLHRNHLRTWYFAIQIVDTKTGAVYQVQTDRRTITARDKQGKLLWKVNPYVDGRLSPYRFEHPIIVYFAISDREENEEGTQRLAVVFSSSQFGILGVR